MRRLRSTWSTVAGLLLCAALWAGCATTPKIDWEARVGHYTFDEAVKELGPPDKYAPLSDGSKVAEWLIQKGYSSGTVYSTFGFGYGYYPAPLFVEGLSSPPSPDYWLRLSFDPQGKLTQWKYYYK